MYLLCIDLDYHYVLLLYSVLTTTDYYPHGQEHTVEYTFPGAKWHPHPRKCHSDRNELQT